MKYLSFDVQLCYKYGESSTVEFLGGNFGEAVC